MRAIGADASAEEWVELAGSCQQLMNVLATMQTVALAEVAVTEDVVREDGTIEEEFRGLGHQRLDAPALVQDRLGLTASGATDRVATAVDLVTRHPALVEAMATGGLDAYRAGIVAEELAEATPEVCAEVVDRIGSRLGTEAGGALRRRTRRVLASVDADLVRRKAERARVERSLRRTALNHATRPLQREELAARPSVTAVSADVAPDVDVHVNASVDARSPSLLEDALEHLTEHQLVELACHPSNLTARNRRALRTGRRVDVSRVEPFSTRGCSRVEIVRVCDRLDADELLFRRHRHRHRSSSRRIRGPSSDDPPPF